MPAVLHFAAAARPVRVLDIGVGMGAYGFMLRQFLDVTHERIEKENWQTVIEGIEVFPRYENPVWAYAYNRIHMGDVRDVLPALDNYDLVVCADVLEHFPLDEARKLIGMILEKAPILIATTPAGHYPQGAWAGNEAETHHCTLHRSDFPHLVAHVRTGETSCFVCASNDDAARKLASARLTCPSLRHSKIKGMMARVLRKLGVQ